MSSKLSMATLMAAAAALGATGVEFGPPRTRKPFVPTNARRRAMTKSAGGNPTNTGNARGRPWAYKANRNDPCPCGSGTKFKKCCYGLAVPSIPAPSEPTPESTPEPTEE
jgi:hypothetical protein